LSLEVSKINKAALTMAIITLVIVMYVIAVETLVDEEIAKAYVVPGLLVLGFSSGMTVATCFYQPRSKSPPY
jgi:hypothetical protein